MAAIGKVFRKENGQSSNKSVYKTAQYERLTQDPSDDDEDETDIIFLQSGRNLRQNGYQISRDSHQNGKSTTHEDIDMSLIQKGKITKGKTDFEVKVMKRRVISRARIWMLLLLVLVAVVIVLSVMLLMPFISKKVMLKSRHQTSEWHLQFDGFTSESCVRLYDVDNDGVKDIIFSKSRPIDLEASKLTLASLTAQCNKLGLSPPCMGSLSALSGHDGSVLWNTSIKAGAFEINCGSLDVNKDGLTDCLAAGRLSLLVAFNPANGDVLWEFEGSDQTFTWNIYNPLVIMDLTGDNTPELIISHGGNPTFPPQNHNRVAGRLVLLDGATGKSLGRYLEMPSDKETYMSPVMHRLKDGSLYILFGSGGETVAGSFLAISLPDLYRYVTNVSLSVVVDNLPGDYSYWNHLKHLQNGVIEIYSGQDKGIMVPPVCVDLTDDGVMDIVMSAYDGTFSAYDGQTLSLLWSLSFTGMESYSSPAPGLFNDDDTPDLMVQWNKGAWPHYTQSMTVILDGKNGEKLWSTNASKFDMTSGLVVMTTDNNHDLFLFHTQGRNAPTTKQMMKRSASPRLYDSYPQSLGDYPSAPDDYPSQPRDYPQQRYPTFHDSIDRRRPLNSRYEPRPRPLWRQPIGNDADYGRGPLHESAAMTDEEPLWSERQEDDRLGQRLSHRDQPQPHNPDPTRHRTSQDRQQTDQNRQSGRNRQRTGQNRHQQESQKFFGGNEFKVDDAKTKDGGTKVAYGAPIPPRTHARLNDIDEEKAADDVNEDDVDDVSVSCDGDLSVFDVETFIVDRSTLKSPLLIATDHATTHTYHLTPSQQSVAAGAVSRSHRDRRHTGPLLAPDTDPSLDSDRCTAFTQQLTQTGALGDVDGDRTLDYVYLYSTNAPLTDTNSAHIGQLFAVHVRKVNLETRVRSSTSEDFVTIKAAVSESMGKEESSTGWKSLKFSEDQTWGEYMGVKSQSMYRRKTGR